MLWQLTTKEIPNNHEPRIKRRIKGRSIDDAIGGVTDTISNSPFQWWQGLQWQLYCQGSGGRS
jgi:hypothetical protein